MSHPVHTPYDGSTRPFTIGLQALDIRDWIEVDDRLATYLAEKDTLFTEKHDVVFRAEPDTQDAQSEVLELLLDCLPQRYPEQYTANGNAITIQATGQSYAQTDFPERPLELAARLIQDDLVLMRPGPEGHRLVAAALCFPSSWSLAEKFGHPLADIHTPVPGFARGTRTAAMIERIFENLKTGQPVERYNWSLYDEPRLHYIERNHAGDERLWQSGNPNAWIRVERQTLRRLPGSGDILFTIKICVDPLTILQKLPDGAALARSLAQQLNGLDEKQLAYKGLRNDRARIIATLERLADQAPAPA